MTLKTIFIDMDNTLIETQDLYEDAHAELARLIMVTSACGEEEIIRKTREEEARLYGVYKYDDALLPKAFEYTLLHYVPDADAATIAAAHKIANTVYEREAEKIAGAMEAVRLLARHHKICLLTAGDAEVQGRRVETLTCKDVLHRIFIVPEKNADTYMQVLAETKTAAHEALMIGDSLNSDIIPAVKAGLEAIFIPAANWHAREGKGASLPEKGATVFDSILEAAQEICARKTGPGKEKRRKPRSPAL